MQACAGVCDLRSLTRTLRGLLRRGRVERQVARQGEERGAHMSSGPQGLGWGVVPGPEASPEAWFSQ